MAGVALARTPYGQGEYGQGAYGQGVGARSAGQASAQGSLSEPTLAMGGQAYGQASVSGSLSIKQALQAVAAGSSSAQGRLTAVQVERGQSNGSSSASGDLTIPIIVGIAGESHGGSTVANPYWSDGLTVTRAQYIEGSQDEDWHGENENLPPMGGGQRDRAHFTPRSIGHVSNKQEVGHG